MYRFDSLRGNKLSLRRELEEFKRFIYETSSLSLKNNNGHIMNADSTTSHHMDCNNSTLHLEWQVITTCEKYQRSKGEKKIQQQ